MNIRSRSFWVVILSIVVVGGGLFYLAHYRNIHLSDIFQALMTFGWKTVAIAFAFVMGQVICQASLLWSLIPGRLNFGWWGPGATAFAQGQLVNSFLPARAGEAVKAISLHRQIGHELPLSTAAGVLVAEKAASGFSLIFFCLLAGRQWLAELNTPSSSFWFGLVVAHAFLIGGAWVLYKVRPSAFHRGRNGIMAVLRGFSVVKDPRRLLLLTVIGLGSWLFELMALQSLCAGQGQILSASQVLWVIVVLNLGIAIPISVANVGAFEAALAFGLSRFGIGESQGIAIATAHHLLQILGIVLLFLVMSVWVARNGRPPSRKSP